MFNPTHASHMEGSWERMVGVARCILDSPLLDVKKTWRTIYWQHVWHKFHPSWMFDPSHLVRPSLHVHFSPRNLHTKRNGRSEKSSRLIQVPITAFARLMCASAVTEETIHDLQLTLCSSAEKIVKVNEHVLYLKRYILLIILLILGNIFYTSPYYKLTLYVKVFFWCCGD